MHVIKAPAVLLLFLWLSLTASASEELPVKVLRAGQWSAWIKVTAPVYGTSSPRALTYHQVVFRQGPLDKEPVQLFEQKSTGIVRIALRDDGVLFLQPVGELPCLYFPESAKPLSLHFLPPRRWEKPFSPYPNIDQNGHISLLGDVLFYGRDAYPGHYLIGFVRIDARRKQITENRLCVEVSTEREPDANARAANIGLPAPVRVGDYVFWKNAGYQNGWYPDSVTGIWKARKTRIIDLKTGEIVTLERVPIDILRKHREVLAEFIEG